MGLSNIHVDVLWRIFLQFKCVHKSLKNLYICTDFQFYSVVLAIEDYVNIVETLCQAVPTLCTACDLNAGWGLGTPCKLFLTNFAAKWVTLHNI